ncbi:MAG: S49 family peptidase [Acidimicrobiales bacterium]
MPFQGLVARESIGRAVGRTVAKTLAAVVTFGVAVLGLILVIGVAISGVSTTAADSALPTTFVAGDEGNANKLLAVPVTGVILGEQTEEAGLFSALTGVTYGYQVKADLEEAATRNDIKGVVLEMDTPGGTIFGSKAIADAVATYRERTGRPVLAHVRGLSASGGVYAMAGADSIVADHGTLVGSIGVIFGPINEYDNVIATEGGLLGGGVETTGGITEYYITAGTGKDLGNPYRPRTDDERKVLQQGVDNNYNALVQHVAAGRGIDEAAIRDKLRRASSTTSRPRWPTDWSTPSATATRPTARPPSWPSCNPATGRWSASIGRAAGCSASALCSAVPGATTPRRSTPKRRWPPACAACCAGAAHDARLLRQPPAGCG